MPLDTDELLNKLKPAVDRLQGLLNDPQTGLISWTTMMLREWMTIANLWEGPTEPAETSETRADQDPPASITLAAAILLSQGKEDALTIAQNLYIQTCAAWERTIGDVPPEDYQAINRSARAAANPQPAPTIEEASCDTIARRMEQLRQESPDRPGFVALYQALTEGEGRGLSTREMAAFLDRELHYSEMAALLKDTYRELSLAMHLLREMGFRHQNPEHQIWEKWQAISTRIDSAAYLWKRKEPREEEVQEGKP